MATDDRTGANGGERFTGHGPEWKDAGLSAEEVQTATAWVEQRVDKRSMLTNKDRVKDVRDLMWQLEKDGEIVVHRVADTHDPVTVKTLYGWDKVIPTRRLWHHKSCGQCGNRLFAALQFRTHKLVGEFDAFRHTHLIVQ